MSKEPEESRNLMEKIQIWKDLIAIRSDFYKDAWTSFTRNGIIKLY